MNYRNSIQTLLLLGLIVIPTLAHGQPRSDLIYAFRSYDATRKTQMILVGEIRSKTKVAEPHNIASPYLDYDNRLDQVTVKVKNPEGVKPGQKLYVIEKNPFHSQYRNGLIVGEITVKSMTHNPFYGWLLTGQGNLLRVRKGNFVARTLETEQLQRAFVLKKKGDLYRNRGDVDRSIAHYSEALEADSSLPEAHAALGEIYLRMAKERGDEDPIRAQSEFELAWKHRENFRFDVDEEEFYRNFMRTLQYRYDLMRTTVSTSMNLFRLLDRSIEVGEEYVTSEGTENTEILTLLFCAHFNRMSYYSGLQDSRSRDEYEKSADKAIDILESLLKRPISDPDFHRCAALYYDNQGGGPVTPPGGIDVEMIKKMYRLEVYSLYRVSRMIEPRQAPREMLLEMIRYHVEKYFRYGSAIGIDFDPEMQALKRRINE